MGCGGQPEKKAVVQMCMFQYVSVSSGKTATNHCTDTDGVDQPLSAMRCHKSFSFHLKISLRCPRQEQEQVVCARAFLISCSAGSHFHKPDLYSCFSSEMLETSRHCNF